MTRIGLRRGNLRREIESLITVAHNDAMKTKNIKAKIDDTQENCECRICANEKMYHIVSECSK